MIEDGRNAQLMLKAASLKSQSLIEPTHDSQKLERFKEFVATPVEVEPDAAPMEAAQIIEENNEQENAPERAAEEFTGSPGIAPQVEVSEVLDNETLSKLDDTISIAPIAVQITAQSEHKKSAFDIAKENPYIVMAVVAAIAVLGISIYGYMKK